MGFGFYPHLFWRPNPEDYNCSANSYEEWALTGNQSKVLGVYFFTVGIIILILYAFVIYTMTSRVFLTKACWKIMYFNCYVDCGNILVSCVFTGILFYEGGVFCTWPLMSYVGGGIGLGCWCASCVNCIAIAINRCCTIFNKGQNLFKGFRAYIWIGSALTLMLYTMFFTRPPIFNSKMGAWFYYPFIEDFQTESKTIINVVHPFVNCVTAATISILYFFLCVYLLSASSKMAKTKQRLLRLQKNVFIQSVAVCGSSCAAAYIYVYMQFFPVPSWMIIWASLGYQMCSALPCLVYLTLNHEIKHKAALIIEESFRSFAANPLLQGKQSEDNGYRSCSLLLSAADRRTATSTTCLDMTSSLKQTVVNPAIEDIPLHVHVESDEEVHL